MTETLKPALLNWEDGPLVRSQHFGDIYFSDIDGLEETRHVFLNGNNLPERFAALGGRTDNPTIIIGELGFGTGLNVTAAWEAWQNRGHNQGHLHLCSVEGMPLCPTDFRKIQDNISAKWPELTPYCQRLSSLYPPLINGFHTLRLADDITLILAFGDVTQVLPEMTVKADAWFLDGFSPATNPAMWTDEVLAGISRLSAPTTTIATFTVAGAVRRGLSSNGFSIEKKPGFGRKREMLTGRLEQVRSSSTRATPWFSTQNLFRQSGNRATVIGAGIAGASAAWHLKRAGYEVSVYDPAGPAAGASGNPVGLVFPRLDLGKTVAARFYLSAWLYTIRLIEQLEIETDISIFNSHGGLRLSLNKETTEKNHKLRMSSILPEDLLGFVSTETAQSIAGQKLCVPKEALHLLFKQGGTITPPHLVKILLGNTHVRDGTLVSFDPASIDEPVRVHLNTPEGVLQTETDILVIATSVHANSVMKNPVLTASHGQIDTLKVQPPDCAVSFGPYAAPLDQHTVIGATYHNEIEQSVPLDTPERSEENLAAVAKVLAQISSDAVIVNSRAAIRGVTNDRHPVSGPLPDWNFYDEKYAGLSQGKIQPYPAAAYQKGVFILTGLGSRGLVTAPYCAHLMCALARGAPCPAEHSINEMLHPSRFFIRSLKRHN